MTPFINSHQFNVVAQAGKVCSYAMKAKRGPVWPAVRGANCVASIPLRQLDLQAAPTELGGGMEPGRLEGIDGGGKLIGKPAQLHFEVLHPRGHVDSRSVGRVELLVDLGAQRFKRRRRMASE